jgi:integrase
MWPCVRRRERQIKGEKRVDYVIDLGRVDGARKVLVKHTLEEANAEAQLRRQERDRLGVIARNLTSQQRIEAANCFQKLAATGMSLASCVNFALEHRGLAENRKQLSDVFSMLIEAQMNNGLRPVSIRETRGRLAGFVSMFGKTSVVEITANQIEDWLSVTARSSQHRSTLIRYLHLMFAFAVRKGMLRDNPVKRVEKPKLRKHLPEFLSVEQVEALFRQAEDKDKDMIPKLALGFFAGIRTEELNRMDWKDISFENGLITIRPEIAKTHSARHIDMSPNLRAWLERYKKSSGPIGLKNKRFGEHRRKLQFAAQLDDWKTNAMRHTFATMHLAMWEDAGKTAFQLGHIHGLRLLYNNYRGLSTKAEAERYWAIVPEGKVHAAIARVV